MIAIPIADIINMALVENGVARDRASFLAYCCAEQLDSYFGEERARQAKMQNHLRCQIIEILAAWDADRAALRTSSDQASSGGEVGT